MSKQTTGVVVPFTLSAATMRQRAADYRRHGRSEQALPLLRQSLERDDTPAARLALGETLLSLGCYEQASSVLYRLLSRDDAPTDAWLLLARCQQALSHTTSAQDCLYHFLSDDPYSAGADEARRMLNQLEVHSDRHEMFRLPKLQHRALAAWKQGDRDRAVKQFRRAIRISTQPARIHATLGLLYLAEDENTNAFKHLSAALKREPTDPRTNTAMCLVLHSLGMDAEAEAQLQQTAGLCQTPGAEDLFVTTAQAMSHIAEAAAYLRERLRRQPCRIALMHALAPLLHQLGGSVEANGIYQRILDLDPGDQRARACLALLDDPRDPSLADNKLLHQKLHRRLTDTLADALVDSDLPDADVLLQPGSASRQMADWIFDHDEPSLQATLLNLLLKHAGPNSKRLHAYLRELLTLPTVPPSLCHKALLFLHDQGHTEPAPILMGPRIGIAQCVDDSSHQRRWPLFLRQFLHETRSHRQSMPMAVCAADWWRELTDTQRNQAISDQGYAYVKAMEILYLRYTGQEEAAGRVIDRIRTSPRRISRIMRRLEPDAEPLKGVHTHEMHRL